MSNCHSTEKPLLLKNKSVSLAYESCRTNFFCPWRKKNCNVFNLMNEIISGFCGICIKSDITQPWPYSFSHLLLICCILFSASFGRHITITLSGESKNFNFPPEAQERDVYSSSALLKMAESFTDEEIWVLTAYYNI